MCPNFEREYGMVVALWMFQQQECIFSPRALVRRNPASAKFTAEHYTDFIMGAIASKIPSLTIVYSTVYSDADQRKHRSPRHWPLCGEFTGDRWIPRTNGQLRGNCFHLMTSSWVFLRRTIPWSESNGYLLSCHNVEASSQVSSKHTLEHLFLYIEHEAS